MNTYICELFDKLVAPKNLASFITTILGVFLGFLLSSWQYKRQREKEQNQLELKYTSLIKNELKNNIKYIKTALKDINKKINEEEFDENNITQEEANKLKEIIKSNSQYLTSTINNKALLSAKRIGALQPIMLDKVTNAYDCYEVAINFIKPYQKNIEAGKILANKNHYFKVVQRLKQYCQELNDVFEEAIKEIKELEEELK